MPLFDKAVIIGPGLIGASLGLAMAARSYEANRGIPFARFALCKGWFLAVDQMRKDGILHRHREKPAPGTVPLTRATESPRADSESRTIEARDLCATLLGKLKPLDRRLLTLYYADHLTFREISDVLQVSESSVCFRHKALVTKLRTQARGGPKAQVRRS